jgi:hypothetical protein
MATDYKTLAQNKIKDSWPLFESALALCEVRTLTRVGRDTAKGTPTYTPSAVEADVPFMVVRYLLTEIRQAQKSDDLDYNPEDRKFLVPFLLVQQEITNDTILTDASGQQWAVRQPIELDPFEALYTLHCRKTQIQL